MNRPVAIALATILLAGGAGQEDGRESDGDWAVHG